MAKTEQCLMALRRKAQTHFGAYPDDEYTAMLCAEALYWWCNDNHSGQNSTEYEILSNLGYRPGLTQTGPESSLAVDLYDYLTEVGGPEGLDGET